MPKPAILQCPWCQGLPSVQQFLEWNVACKCGAEGPCYSTEAAAIAAWNGVAGTGAKVAALKSALEEATPCVNMVVEGRWFVNAADRKMYTPTLARIGAALKEAP